MARWRVPAALSAVVILAQLARTDPLLDVVSGHAPDGVRLTYPLAHVLLTPLTLAADWLNGGSRADLVGFAAWALAAWVFARVFFGAAPRRVLREAGWTAAFLTAFAAFIGWGALLPRPVPRLVTADPALVIFDVHSHTSASHDGRAGFDLAANAAWHARAGFHAAFITDHNVIGLRPPEGARPGARLLPGEELSLSGLHVLALGARTPIANAPWNRTFDSTLLLLRRLASDTSAERPYLVASLPEYWRYHWGTDIGVMTDAGIEGFEIWTTSPKAMDLPPEARAEIVARSALEGHALFGATDMHGLGNAATVWNVMRLPGWDTLNDAALTAALLARFRAAGPASHQVVALRRWQAGASWAAPAAVPLNLGLRLRTMTRGHAAALLGWLWLPALLATVRRRPR